jgi:hypothetical protein
MIRVGIMTAFVMVGHTAKNYRTGSLDNEPALAKVI